MNPIPTIVNEFLSYNNNYTYDETLRPEYFNHLLQALQTPLQASARDLESLRGRLSHFVGASDIPTWLQPTAAQAAPPLRPEDLFLAISQNKPELISKLFTAFPREFAVIKDASGKSPLWYLLKYQPGLVSEYLPRFPQWIESPLHSPDALLRDLPDPNRALNLLNFQSSKELLAYLSRCDINRPDSPLIHYLTTAYPGKDSPCHKKSTWMAIQEILGELVTKGQVDSARRLLQACTIVWPSFSRNLMILAIDPTMSVFNMTDFTWGINKHMIPRKILEEMGITNWVNYSENLPDQMISLFYALHNRLNVSLPFPLLERDKACFEELNVKPQLDPLTGLPPPILYMYWPITLSLYQPGIFSDEAKNLIRNNPLPETIGMNLHFFPKETRDMIAQMKSSHELLLNYLQNAPARLDPDRIDTLESLLKSMPPLTTPEERNSLFRTAFEKASPEIMRVVLDSDHFKACDKQTLANLAKTRAMEDFPKLAAYLVAGSPLSHEEFMKWPIEQLFSGDVHLLIRGWLGLDSNGIALANDPMRAIHIAKTLIFRNEYDLAYQLLQRVYPNPGPLLESQVLFVQPILSNVIQNRIELLNYALEPLPILSIGSYEERKRVTDYFKDDVRQAVESLQVEGVETKGIESHNSVQFQKGGRFQDVVVGAFPTLKRSFDGLAHAHWMERAADRLIEGVPTQADFDARKVPILYNASHPETGILVYRIDLMTGEPVSKWVSRGNEKTQKEFINLLASDYVNQMTELQQPPEIIFTRSGKVNYQFKHIETDEPVTTSFYGLNKLEGIKRSIEERRAIADSAKALSQALHINFIPQTPVDSLPPDKLPGIMMFHKKLLFLLDRSHAVLTHPKSSPEDIKEYLTLIGHIDNISVSREAIQKIPYLPEIVFPSESVALNPSILLSTPLTNNPENRDTVNYFIDAVSGRLDSVAGWRWALHPEEPPSAEYKKFHAIISHVIQDAAGTPDLSLVVQDICINGRDCSSGLVNLAKRQYERIRSKLGEVKSDTSPEAILSGVIDSSAITFESLLLQMKADHPYITQSVHISSLIQRFLHEKGVLRVLSPEAAADLHIHFGEKVYSREELEFLFQKLFPLIMVTTFQDKINTWYGEVDKERLGTIAIALKEAISNELAKSDTHWVPQSSPSGSSSSSSSAVRPPTSPGKRSAEAAEIAERDPKARTAYEIERDNVDEVNDFYNLTDEMTSLPTFKGILVLLESRGILKRASS